jgi:hypothetical protein
MTRTRSRGRRPSHAVRSVIAATTLAAGLTSGAVVASQEAAATPLTPMACPQGRVIDLSGSSVVQSNNTTVAIDQWTISGAGSIRRVSGQAHFAGGAGPLVGSTSGTGVDFVIAWSTTSWGIYTGRLNRNNSLTGTSYDLFTPTTRATWNTPGSAKCV